MIALIDKLTRQCVALVEDAGGYDPALYDQAPGPVGDPREWRWDTASESWTPRPPTVTEQAVAALDVDTRWQAMRTATPEQVESWLTANVTDLASARRVLKILVLAVQKLSVRP